MVAVSRTARLGSRQRVGQWSTFFWRGENKTSLCVVSGAARWPPRNQRMVRDARFCRSNDCRLCKDSRGRLQFDKIDANTRPNWCWRPRQYVRRPQLIRKGRQNRKDRVMAAKPLSTVAHAVASQFCIVYRDWRLSTLPPWASECGDAISAAGLPTRVHHRSAAAPSALSSSGRYCWRYASSGNPFVAAAMAPRMTESPPRACLAYLGRCFDLHGWWAAPFIRHSRDDVS